MRRTTNSLRRSLFLPKDLALGSELSSNGGAFKPFRLSSSAPWATIDYGVEVAGYPFFDVSSVKGPVQIEVKYAEEFLALKHNFSDGPFPYAIALTNTYRVETFEITKPGRLDSFLAQGGQRWQSIELLTNGSVTFSLAGFVPSIPIVDIDNLPGRFVSNDQSLNEIWKASFPILPLFTREILITNSIAWRESLCRSVRGGWDPEIHVGGWQERRICTRHESRDYSSGHLV